MKTPDKIHNVSSSELSLAIDYGGCFFNGKEYVYFADEDKLVRKDLLKKKKPKKKDNNRIKQTFNQNQKPMSKKKTRHSAKDGKFVSKEFAESNPEKVVEVTNHDHKTELEKFRSWIIENGKDINSESVVSEYLTEK